jgi:hypothetical protein
MASKKKKGDSIHDFISEPATMKNTSSSKKRKRKADTDEDTPPPPPSTLVPAKNPLDNTPLKYTKTIDKKDGSSFDYVKSSDVRKLLPRSLEEEMMCSSCDEREQAEEEHGMIQEEEEKEIPLVAKKKQKMEEERYDDDEEQEENIVVPPSSSESEDVGELLKKVKDTRNLNTLAKQHASSAAPTPRKRPLKFCFGCSWHDTHQGGVSADAVTKMMRTMYKYCGTMPAWELSRLIHEEFRDEIYYPLLEEREKLENNRRLFGEKEGEFYDDELTDVPRSSIKEKIPIWRTYEIYRHIKYHIRDPRILVLNMVDDLQQDIQNLTGMSYSFVKDAEGNSYPLCDKEALKTKLDYQKQLIAVYKLEPKKMLFYNDKLPVDMNAQGSAININKTFSYTKNK